MLKDLTNVFFVVVSGTLLLGCGTQKPDSAPPDKYVTPTDHYLAADISSDMTELCLFTSEKKEILSGSYDLIKYNNYLLFSQEYILLTKEFKAPLQGCFQVQRAQFQTQALPLAAGTQASLYLEYK